MQWSIPNGIEISAECRDLLTRMLVRNPDDRITMAEIHKHPWFIANLPVEVRQGSSSWCRAFTFHIELRVSSKEREGVRLGCGA
jgi:serine/threonine protein kinase